MKPELQPRNTHKIKIYARTGHEKKQLFIIMSPNYVLHLHFCERADKTKIINELNVVKKILNGESLLVSNHMFRIKGVLVIYTVFTEFRFFDQKKKATGKTINSTNALKLNTMYQ